ncbi:hypothetical protein GJ689_25035 [Rhodoplanes serenus]|uniref:Uncharacterized protein n=1 Tax=Rhodoplanes serenus TaxID=200615 RepID=A0A9X5AVE5_9BRAD|nr:hypothetical protein [Rhodoplanes serenus]MTW19460.1 hypothetical protein [Rhodoplanes serenus]
MEILNSLPDLVQVFAVIGGFATVYKGWGIATKLWTSWQSAPTTKARLAAVETASAETSALLREVLAKLDNKPAAPDQAKGGLG